MKRIIPALFILLLYGCSHSSNDWTLVWREDFDDRAIDSESWTRVAKGKSDWNDMMSLRQDLAFIKDGDLVLLGKPNDGSSEDTTAFVTGGVTTKGKRSFDMARFEIKAKFNSADGFWPALWLMPEGNVPWPKGGEIDIMEHLNKDDIVYQTVHSLYTQNVDMDNPPHSSTAPIDKDDWNIYAAEVYPDSICLYTNNVKTLTYPWVQGKENQFPWDEYSYYIILSNQLGGKWVGEVNPKDLPSELRIDWIKVYQKKK